MKQQVINIIANFIILFLITACGNNNTTTETHNNKTTTIISVNEPQQQKAFLQKSSNLDLNIANMRIDVYTADSETDEDPSDNTLFLSQAFPKSSGPTWTVALEGLLKDTAYIFVVSAFNSEDNVSAIFTGVTTHAIVSEEVNNININLVASSTLYSNIETDKIISIQNLTSVQHPNGEVTLSFYINNPNSNEVTWQIYHKDGTTVATEFSLNSGTTAEVLSFIELIYTPTVENTIVNYILKAKDSTGAISYTFSIDMTKGESAAISVKTPPIVIGLNVSYVEEGILLIPNMSYRTDNTTFKWSNDTSIKPFISKPTDNFALLSYDRLHFVDSFDIKVQVSDGNSSSYRIFTLNLSNYSQIKLIDTSDPRVIEILGIPKEEADALLALYVSTDGENWKDNSNWNTLSSVADWYGVETASEQVRTGKYVYFIDLEQNGLSGTLPSQLGNLTNLAALFLSGNQLMGNIPSSFGNLINLEDLDLHFNLKLSGTIPSSL
ncbi:MAG TPA: hypothetical protein ENK68_02965, partial [Epsilonproteobacteria bacterium]|nr:hypothetical protein [Campylobacterota bacterium]